MLCAGDFGMPSKDPGIRETGLPTVSPVSANLHDRSHSQRWGRFQMGTSLPWLC
jgi:hypothetical protein